MRKLHHSSGHEIHDATLVEVSVALGISNPSSDRDMDAANVANGSSWRTPITNATPLIHLARIGRIGSTPDEVTKPLPCGSLFGRPANLNRFVRKLGGNLQIAAERLDKSAKGAQGHIIASLDFRNRRLFDAKPGCDGRLRHFSSGPKLLKKENSLGFRGTARFQQVEYPGDQFMLVRLEFVRTPSVPCVLGRDRRKPKTQGGTILDCKRPIPRPDIDEPVPGIFAGRIDANGNGGNLLPQSAGQSIDVLLG